MILKNVLVRRTSADKQRNHGVSRREGFSEIFSVAIPYL
jgi:hypothetical protein